MFPYIYNTFWITDDKVLHFIVSFFITFTFYTIFQHINKKSSYKFSDFFIFINIAFILFFVSLWKEIMDSVLSWHNVEFMDVLTNYFWMLFFYCLIFINYFFKKI